MVLPTNNPHANGSILEKALPEGVLTAQGHPALLRRVQRLIRDEGPISFARFMELALYDPEHGYYTRGPSRLGPEGDFVTASDVGRELGRCLARQLVDDHWQARIWLQRPLFRVDRHEGAFAELHEQAVQVTRLWHAVILDDPLVRAHSGTKRLP